VFERFSEHARRAIFFGRAEAQLLHAERMETEHLLLGILRDDKRGVSELSTDAVAAIRRRTEQSAPQPKLMRATADLPLSDECKSVLVFGSKEADALQHMIIDTPHLLLGMLRIEECTGAKLLREQGVDYDQYRAAVREQRLEQPRFHPARDRPVERPSPWNEAPTPAAAPSLAPSILALENLLDGAIANVDAYSDHYGEHRLKRAPRPDKPWTRKEALGHLIDWAMAHQQWFALALAESNLTAAGYPSESEVSIQYYPDLSWADAVDLWVSLNRLLVHVLLRVAEDKVNVPCRIGIADRITLAELVARYVSHCEDIVGQILARL
jgi:Clp amino terminal domain, pathogenicity island component